MWYQLKNGVTSLYKTNWLLKMKSQFGLLSLQSLKILLQIIKPFNSMNDSLLLNRGIYDTR